jgi:hypothetical protein
MKAHKLVIYRIFALIGKKTKEIQLFCVTIELISGAKPQQLNLNYKTITMNKLRINFNSISFALYGGKSLNITYQIKTK